MNQWLQVNGSDSESMALGQRLRVNGSESMALCQLSSLALFETKGRYWHIIGDHKKRAEERINVLKKVARKRFIFGPTSINH